jgi:hypothetical protein
LYRRNNGNTQHISRKTQKQAPDNGTEAGFVGDETAACAGHAQSPVIPSHRSDTVDPNRNRARPEKAERGCHAVQKAKSSLTRDDHAPRSDD